MSIPTLEELIAIATKHQLFLDATKDKMNIYQPFPDSNGYSFCYDEKFMFIRSSQFKGTEEIIDTKLRFSVQSDQVEKALQLLWPLLFSEKNPFLYFKISDIYVDKKEINKIKKSIENIGKKLNIEENVLAGLEKRKMLIFNNESQKKYKIAEIDQQENTIQERIDSYKNEKSQLEAELQKIERLILGGQFIFYVYTIYDWNAIVDFIRTVEDILEKNDIKVGIIPNTDVSVTKFSSVRRDYDENGKSVNANERSINDMRAINLTSDLWNFLKTKFNTDNTEEKINMEQPPPSFLRMGR